MIIENKQKLLQSTIKWLEYGNKFYISVHDISGIFHNNPFLELDIDNQIHNLPLCKIAKSTPTGLRFCLKCKTQSIKRALKEKEIYTGHCYLGITEIVKSVHWKNKPLGKFIYLFSIDIP